jgi:hypothetical protein
MTPRVMRISLILAVAVVGFGCVAHRQPAPAKPVAPTARPFSTMPKAVLLDRTQPGPMYRVQLEAAITRDVIPTDDLAIVVSVDDHEVGRYPIVGRFKTKVKQEIELPLGDYEIDYDYQGAKYAGMPFRLAEVPVWGGKHAIQLRTHQGTRLSLREKKMWVGRWWSNDGPPQAWIIEWVRDGAVATTTSGTDQYGMSPESHALVGGAAGAFRSEKVVPNTIWTYGEEYPIPDVVVTTPGAWAARVVHGSSASISVVFTVLPGSKLAEGSDRKVLSVGWEPSWSKKLDARALSITEVDRLTAMLPQVSSSQPFDEPRTDGAIRVSTAAIRALFRSKQLAEMWSDYLKATSIVQPAAMAPKKKEPTSPAKLKAMRQQIEALIKSQGGPWTPEEHPHS